MNILPFNLWDLSLSNVCCQGKLPKVWGRDRSNQINFSWDKWDSENVAQWVCHIHLDLTVLIHTHYPTYPIIEKVHNFKGSGLQGELGSIWISWGSPHLPFTVRIGISVAKQFCHKVKCDHIRLTTAVLAVVISKLSTVIKHDVTCPQLSTSCQLGCWKQAV